jgi:hypothetical protein
MCSESYLNYDKSCKFVFLSDRVFTCMIAYETLTPNKTLSTVSNNSRNEFSEMELQMESTTKGK